MPLQIASITHSVELTRRKFARLQRVYRGSITDYCRTIKLGSGYIGAWRQTNLCRTCEKEAGDTAIVFNPHETPKRAQRSKTCQHFEIDTARHLAGPFAAVEDENVRIVMLQKAAQTAGSTFWDMSAHWLLIHSKFMRIRIYFCDSDEKAKRYSNDKLFDTIRSNPDIAKLLPRGLDRFDDSQREIKLLNGKIITVFALNDTNASSLPADVVIIDESWLAKPGLLQKAMDRVKQQVGSKIIIVSQAGDADSDMDRIWKGLNKRVPLTWACPKCQSRQEFELHKQRPSDFKPVLVEGVEPPQPDTYCGFKIPKKISELNTAEEIKAACAQTTVECYHCGFEIEDNWTMRQALQSSYRQEYRETAPDGSLFTPKDYAVGFWNPDPASVFVPFAETMENYILAKKLKDQRGDDEALKTFYLSRWAIAWNPKMAEDLRQRAQADYDVKMAQLGAWRLCMIVDNQMDLMQQWVMVLAVGKDGSARQLWRGPVLGLAEVRKKQLSFGADEKTKRPLISDQNVFLDGQYRPTEIRRHIFENKYGHWRTVGGERVWACWSLLHGTRFNDFSHKDENDVTKRFITGDPTFHGGKVDGLYVEILDYPFSATRAGDLFVSNRDGKGCEYMFLPAGFEPHDLPEKDAMSHHSQIFSNKLVPSGANEPRASRMKYMPVPPSAPDHYFHCWRMFEAVKEIWGIGGNAVLIDSTTPKNNEKSNV